MRLSASLSLMLMSDMATKVMSADEFAKRKGTTALNIRRAARKFRDTPDMFGQYLPSPSGERGRWVFMEEDLDAYDNLPEIKRSPGNKGVQLRLPTTLLEQVDATGVSRSEAAREGLELWLKRQARRGKHG